MVTNANDLKGNEAYNNMQTSYFALAHILCPISGFKKSESGHVQTEGNIDENSMQAMVLTLITVYP